jgi:mono/diheme cytochrome c family protein
MAYDPELDLVYIGVGNGSPWNQGIRSPEGGDNWFLSSIVALRPDTGEYVWHYQTTPGESWDYTATQHIVLADLQIGGQVRKVLMQAPKNGFFYVLDRQTGKVISAAPYSTVNWASGVDLATGRPTVNPEAYYAKTGKPWFAMPGPIGAHNWQPMSFSPVTKLVYIPVHDVPFAFVDNKNFVPNPLAWNIGIFPSDPPDEKGMAQFLATLRGYLKAWDPVAQKERFRIELPGAWNGGVLSTAGGLVFQGDAAGFFKAFASDTGKELWSFQTQTGVIAAPMSYAVAGEQYVAIVVGWGGAWALVAGGPLQQKALTTNRSRVLAFKVGGSAQLPEMPPLEAATRKPPAPFGDPKLVPTGRLLYEGYCAVCHGTEGFAGGVLPDLRWSALLGSSEGWAKVVLGGTRKKAGMPEFGKFMKPEEAELIRAFVVAVANQTYAPPAPAGAAQGDTKPAK